MSVGITCNKCIALQKVSPNKTRYCSKQMKIVYNILVFLLFAGNITAQQLLIQETFRGGVSFDGESESGLSWFDKDTIVFANSVPTGASLRKAYLTCSRLKYKVGGNGIENGVMIDFNGNLITIDSSNVVSPKMTVSPIVPSGEYWVCCKDVTFWALGSGNKLITPDHQALFWANPTYGYGYVYFGLILLYEDPGMSSINYVLYVNNQNLLSNNSRMFNNLNPIDSTKAVALSIFCGNIQPVDSLAFTLNSSLGSNYLGALYMNINNGDPNVLNRYAAGSYFYENNICTGLMDDSPDAKIDSTDALVNIKSLVKQNTTAVSLLSIGNVDLAGLTFPMLFQFAYTTPCPPRGISVLFEDSICFGQSLSLNASTATSYTWYPSAGLNNANIQNPIATPDSSTNYTVLIDSAGCKHTERFSVNVYEIPEPNNVIVQNINCGGPAGYIQSVGLYSTNQTYVYDIGSGPQSSPAFFLSTPGTYTLTITSNAGCSWQNSYTIAEVNTTQANFTTSGLPAVYPATVYFQNNSTGANNYIWYFPNDSSLASNAIYVYNQPGTYSVTLIAYNNFLNCSDTTYAVIEILDSLSTPISNVFSPNGDGINEYFVLANNAYQSMSYSIINRWGEIIKQGDENIRGKSEVILWDGTQKGKLCSEGTYYYSLRLKDYSGKEKTVNGFVMLVR